MGALIERVVKIDSPYLGFIPDFGPFCYAPADIYVNRFLELGVRPEIANRIIEMWHERTPEKIVFDEISKMGGDELAQMMGVESQVYFGHSSPESLMQIMPQIIHVHGKFFHVDDSGDEQAVRYPELITVLKKGGYSGYISCEYEGHHWNQNDDTFSQIKAIQSLIKRNS